ncbi:MAG TPA: hypothetical protein VFN89_07880 [Solirubrobacterales bacterium]|nr:hypothetical protein [Solirubrobacterales bacterium]
MTASPSKTKPKNASQPKKAKATEKPESTVRKTTEFSERVLAHFESGQRGAIEAVRKFMESVDSALPALGPRPTRRQSLIDSALQMSERLVRVELNFIHQVVHDTGETLGGTNRAK